MKKLIFIIIFFSCSNSFGSENIQELLNNKKCVFTNESFTFQKFGVAGVFYKIDDDLKSFNQQIKSTYNMGFQQGSIVNIQMPPEITSTISTSDDKIQYYKLCYYLRKIHNN